MERSERKTQIGINLMAMLMMGTIGVASSLTAIASNFPDASQSAIMSLVSIPCIVIIPVTIITGKLMQVMSKKVLEIIGIVFFIIGGVLPAYMDSLSLILVFRGIFGAGVGIVQVVTMALIAENFEGSKREKVQGVAQSFQMLGCSVMVFLGGWLASQSWNYVFYVHLIGVISLFAALFFIVRVKPNSFAGNESEAPVEKGKLTGRMWFLVIVCFLEFFIGQIYNTSNAYVLAVKGLGNSTASGLGMVFFCLGGIIMGFFYGKLAKILGKYSLGVGILPFALAFFLMAVANNLPVFYIGCFLYGLGCSIFIPSVFVNVAAAVTPVTMGLAVAIATCMQNFGQFLSPYIFNPITAAIGAGIGGDVNIISFYMAAALQLLLGVVVMIKFAVDGKSVRA